MRWGRVPLCHGVPWAGWAAVSGEQTSYVVVGGPRHEVAPQWVMAPLRLSRRLCPRRLDDSRVAFRKATMAEAEGGGGGDGEGNNTLLTLASSGASFANNRLGGFYKACGGVAEFSNIVSALNGKLDVWNSLLKRFGTSEDGLILPTVVAIEEARKCLDREEERLQQTQSAACCTRRRCSRLSFPQELTARFQSVIEAIDGIPLAKTPREEAIEALERARRRRVDNIGTLRFPADDKYVPISESLRELRNALEDEDGRQVVTLYGPPGMGKTKMVQHLALLYQEARQQSKVADADFPEITAVRFPDGVFYLDCGPDADSRAKHLELLHVLESRPELGEVNAVEHDVQVQSDYDVHSRLCARLSGQSVLIILDDVWNQEVVQQLLVPGRDAKYLVTSQNRGVWDDAVNIKIGTPSLKEARDILANYVGGRPPSDHAVPQLQALADEVIRASDFNPLVVANWGLALKGERSTDLEEWRAAKEELLSEQGADDYTLSGPLEFGKLLCPRTAAPSTAMAIDVLPCEAQSLLLLATLCSGPSIPEQVFRIFFESVHGSRRSYYKWRNCLEDRSFIQIQTHLVPWRCLPVRTWSINRLRQYFIRREKTEALSFLVQTLLRENSHAVDSDLVAALSVIYGGEELRAGASKKLGVDIKQNVSLGRCVEPFVRLLGAENGEAWELESLESVKEVLLQYVRKGRLAQNDLLRLLLQPHTSMATCWAIELLAWNWSTLSLWGALADNPQKYLFRWTAKNKAAICVFKGVIDLLRNAGDAGTHRMAANALVALAWASHDITLPVASPALRELVALLSTDASAIAQEAGARALGRLAHLKGRNSMDVSTVGEYYGVIDGLVQLLAKDVTLCVQTAAAEALYFLAGDRSSAGRLVGTRGAIQKLADLLGNDTHPDVQQFAVLTLYNLSCHREIVLANQMKGGFVYLQDLEATNSSLSSIQTSMRAPGGRGQTTVAFPGMLRGLVGLLQVEVKPEVQMFAASTLKRLAEVEVNRLGIVKFPGALEGLTRLLYSQELDSFGLDMITQAEAAETLVALAEVDLNLKQVPGVVKGLQGLLAQEVHPYVQERAARCLTIVDPIRANQITLYSKVAFRARAGANIHMGLFHQALADLEMLEELDPGSQDAFHELRFVKAMISDYRGALIVADRAIQLRPDAHFDWAERGVLKRMMGDYEGALIDLDKALDLGGAVHDYLKQRGYVKFLMGDEEGAFADADTSLDLSPNISYAGESQRTLLDSKFSLSELSVAFLGFAL